MWIESKCVNKWSNKGSSTFIWDCYEHTKVTWLWTWKLPLPLSPTLWNQLFPNIVFSFFLFAAATGFHNVVPSPIHACLNHFCLQWPGARLLGFSLHCHSCDAGEVHCCRLGNHSDPCYWCRDSVNMGKEKVRHGWERSDMSAGGGWRGREAERRQMTRCA